jgi:hypothetical protein
MTARNSRKGNKTSIDIFWLRPQHLQHVVLDLKKERLTELSKNLRDQRIRNFLFVYLEILSIFYPLRNPKILNSVCTPCIRTDKSSVTLSRTTLCQCK